VVEVFRLGVPDNLFTGDGAVLELHTWQAAHGLQLLGPYSRFSWSHPGPAMFYLAAPLYEALHERGPALNVFALLSNLIVAIAIVLTARRLRGDSFAWVTAACLAVLELVAIPILPANYWNPVLPVLPLVLLSLLTVRLALGALTVLPAFLLIASAIVQTHVGFAPVVGVLTVLTLIGLVGRDAPTGARRWQLDPHRRWILLTASGVVVLCWILPTYEAVTTHPSNIARLVEFFTATNPDTQSWGRVFNILRDQLAMMPIAVLLPLRPFMATPGTVTSTVLVFVQIGVVVAALVFGRRRSDEVLCLLAIVTLAEMAVSVVAIRGIRGAVFPYLLYWVVVPGFMTLAVAAAWIIRSHKWWTMGCVGLAAWFTALVVLSSVDRWRVFGDKDVAAEQLARDVERFVTSESLNQPVIRIAGENWPTAAAVILQLRKDGIPFVVEPQWTFVFGAALEDHGGDRPQLFVANPTFIEHAKAERLPRIAGANGVSVYFDPPHNLATHRAQSER
jgi:hypothetical protein